MNQRELNIITQEAFKQIDADVIIVLYNNENGAYAVPIWEHSCEFKNEADMRKNVESKLIEYLINFTDNNGGDSIGTYAMEWDNPESNKE